MYKFVIFSFFLLIPMNQKNSFREWTTIKNLLKNKDLLLSTVSNPQTEGRSLEAAQKICALLDVQLPKDEQEFLDVINKIKDHIHMTEEEISSNTHLMNKISTEWPNQSEKLVIYQDFSKRLEEKSDFLKKIVAVAEGFSFKDLRNEHTTIKQQQALRILKTLNNLEENFKNSEADKSNTGKGSFLDKINNYKAKIDSIVLHLTNNENFQEHSEEIGKKELDTMIVDNNPTTHIETQTAKEEQSKLETSLTTYSPTNEWLPLPVKLPKNVQVNPRFIEEYENLFKEVQNWKFLPLIPMCEILNKEVRIVATKNLINLFSEYIEESMNIYKKTMLIEWEIKAKIKAREKIQEMWNKFIEANQTMYDKLSTSNNIDAAKEAISNIVWLLETYEDTYEGIDLSTICESRDVLATWYQAMNEIAIAGTIYFFLKKHKWYKSNLNHYIKMCVGLEGYNGSSDRDMQNTVKYIRELVEANGEDKISSGKGRKERLLGREIRIPNLEYINSTLKPAISKLPKEWHYSTKNLHRVRKIINFMENTNTLEWQVETNIKQILWEIIQADTSSNSEGEQGINNTGANDLVI